MNHHRNASAASRSRGRSSDFQVFHCKRCSGLMQGGRPARALKSRHARIQRRHLQSASASRLAHRDVES